MKKMADSYTWPAIELAAKYSLLELPSLLFEKAYTKKILDLKSVQIKTKIKIEKTLKLLMGKS